MKSFQNKGKAFIVIVFFSLVGKFSGAGREIVSAYYFGTSDKFAIFLVALLTLSSIIIFVGDIVTPYFTSSYMALIERKDCQAEKLALHTIVIVFVLVMLMALTFYFLMPTIIGVVVAGFSDSMQASTVQMARMLLPWFILSCLVSLLGVIQQCHGIYIPVALNSIILNFIILLCIGTLISYIGVWGLVLGYNIALFFLLLFHWCAIKRIGLNLSLRAFKISAIKEILGRREIIHFSKIGWASILKNIEPLLDYFIGSMIAASAIASFTYAGRINILFLGLIISPFSAIFLPYLSKLSAEDNLNSLQISVNKNVKFYLLLLLPAAVFIMFHRLEIIQVLFQRGSFDAASTASTGLALAIMSTCLPFLGVLEVLKNAFYGQGKINELLIAYFVGITGKLLIGLSLYKMLGSVTISIAAAGYVIIVTILLLAIHFHSGTGCAKNIKEITVSVLKTLVGAIAGISAISLINAFYSSTGMMLTKLAVDFFIFVSVFVIAVKVLRHDDFNYYFHQIRNMLNEKLGR